MIRTIEKLATGSVGAPQEAERAFLLALAQALQAHGTTADGLEDVMIRCARALGVEGQFFSTPTAVFAAFGPPHEQRTSLLRVESGDVDLERLSALMGLARDVAEGRRTVEAARAALDALRRSPPRWGPTSTTLAFGLVSASAARFFGGGWAEIAVSAVLGLLIGLLAVGAARAPGLGRLFHPLAAALAAVGSIAAAQLVVPLAWSTTTLSALIVLLPGFTLTLAMSELATRHLASGTARLVSAVTTFLVIAFGVALGERAAGALLGVPPAVESLPLPEWTAWAAVAAASLALTILFRARPSDVGWVLLAGLVAFVSARFGAARFGPELGACCGAAILAIVSHARARLTGRPAAVTLVPGLMLLVPGSLGFHSVTSLVRHDVFAGVETAFTMLQVAVALVTGLLVAHAVLPEIPRRRERGPAAEELDPGGRRG